MHVISIRRCREFWESDRRHAEAEVPMRAWHAVVAAARWQSFADAKATFGRRVDAFPLGGDKPTATVFDVAGNKYRIATFIDYDKAIVFIKRVMTHAEYNRKRWHDDFYDEV